MSKQKNYEILLVPPCHPASSWRGTCGNRCSPRSYRKELLGQLWSFGLSVKHFAAAVISCSAVPGRRISGSSTRALASAEWLIEVVTWLLQTALAGLLQTHGTRLLFCGEGKTLGSGKGNFLQLGDFNNLTLDRVCLMVGDRADESRHAVYNSN